MISLGRRTFDQSYRSVVKDRKFYRKIGACSWRIEKHEAQTSAKYQNQRKQTNIRECQANLEKFTIFQVDDSVQCKIVTCCSINIECIKLVVESLCTIDKRSSMTISKCGNSFNQFTF